MKLADYLSEKGQRFFRVRSYLPLLLLPLVYFERGHFRAPIGSELAERMFELGCFLISLLGEGIRISTVGYIPRHTSGRNVTAQRADTLNTGGMYSIVRNPLYLGDFFMALGVVLLFRSAALTAAMIQLSQEISLSRPASSLQTG